MKPPSPPLVFSHFGEHYKWLVLSVIGTGVVAAVLPSTSFIVAVPALVHYFGVNQSEVQLVVTAFLVANTIAMLPAPWLIERYGLRLCFLATMALLTTSSILGALSQNFLLLVTARVLQGVTAGILMPIGSIVIMGLFPPNKQGKASGFMGFGVILAPTVAPAIGGLMIDNIGWQTVFLMSLPFCAIAWLGAVRYLPRPLSPRHDYFDWTGMTALSLITLAALGCASNISNSYYSLHWAIGTALMAFVSLVFFLRHSLNPRAIVTHEVLCWRPVSMGMVVSFVYGFGIYGSSYLIPVFLQTVRGFNATQAGSFLLPGGLALAITLPVAGLLADRFAPRLIVLAGLAMLGASFAALWYLALSISYSYLVWITILGRVGIGFLIAALNQAALQGLNGRVLGQSAMVVSYTRMLGGFLGVALLAAFVEWRSKKLGAIPAAIAQAFCESFLLSTLVFALAMAAAWRMKPNVR